jgi:CxxC-x17-CxxC domain-containing protein
MGDFRGGGGRRFNNNRSFDDRPREMHKATCAECKKECEVPFKPTEGRDVFCKDCFQKHKKF